MQPEEEERLTSYLERDVSTLTSNDILEFRLLLDKKTEELRQYVLSIMP